MRIKSCLFHLIPLNYIKQNNIKVYKNINTYIGQLFGLGHVFILFPSIRKKRKPFVYELK